MLPIRIFCATCRAEIKRGEPRTVHSVDGDPMRYPVCVDCTSSCGGAFLSVLVNHEGSLYLARIGEVLPADSRAQKGSDT